VGVGTIEKRPVVVSREGGGAIAIRWMGYLCLSYDHRVVDGAVAGRFLRSLRRTLESYSAGQGIWSDPLLQSLQQRPAASPLILPVDLALVPPIDPKHTPLDH